MEGHVDEIEGGRFAKIVDVAEIAGVDYLERDPWKEESEDCVLLNDWPLEFDYFPDELLVKELNLFRSAQSIEELLANRFLEVVNQRNVNEFQFYISLDFVILLEKVILHLYSFKPEAACGHSVRIVFEVTFLYRCG